VRILYVAAGIDVPGAHGGSTHTWEVARGLADLGHEVLVAAHRPRHAPRGTYSHTVIDGVHLRYVDIPKSLSLVSYPVIASLVRRWQPAVLMERYYNLAGAGVLAACRANIPVLLEVNALIVDPPAVFKRRLDDRLGGPLRRWATWQCQHAARIVTPLATTVPSPVERAKIVELPWGANVDRFRPVSAAERARLRTEMGVPRDRPVVVFAGSFRAWHGVHDFVAAACLLLDEGAPYSFVLVGDGPEHAAAMEAAAPYGEHIRFMGSVPHDMMPRTLALADVGVAPFNTASHPALRAAGFFWSPLKIYEYMATGLPTVTPRIPPLDTTIRDSVEGALYAEGDIVALAAAIRRVVDAPDRAAMGQRARARVEQDFSWQRHCRELSRIMQHIAGSVGG
jgi:glycosyltransferase involved in cell wall biosynthesis